MDHLPTDVKIDLFVFQKTSEWTNGRIENIMPPPGSLVWQRHKKPRNVGQYPLRYIYLHRIYAIVLKHIRACFISAVGSVTDTV